MGSVLIRRLCVKGATHMEVKENAKIANNSAMRAYEQVAEDFKGAAAEAGFETEEQLQEYMKEIRKEVRGY